MFDAILLIAGKGERANLPYNKVFYSINKKPLYRYALDTFLSCSECRKVIIVAALNELDSVRNQLEFSNRIDFAVGGCFRQDSVAAGIEKCETEVVLIHDGARPMIEKRFILEVYEQTKNTGSAVLAVKTTDTIREVKDGKTNLIDREFLWNMQTPQGVNRSLYNIALKKARNDCYFATDDVALLEKYFGIVPAMVPGSYLNIKATTSDDLEYISHLIKEKKK